MFNASTTPKPLPSTQNAVLIQEFGTPEVLKYQSGVSIPKLADEQVLIKVAYAGINPVDYKTRQGKGWGADVIREHTFEYDKGVILGFDVVGEVVSSNTRQFTIGDTVAALTFNGGCYAEYVTVDSNLLAKVPYGVTLEEAGALPCIGQTAIQFMEFADIKKGEYVVMNAPAGGVGHLLIQLLMKKVAQDDIKLTVICSPEKYAKLDELIERNKLTGWIDYTKDTDFPDLQADVLLDLVGGDAGVRALSVVRTGGRVKVLPTIWVDTLKEAGDSKGLSVDGYGVEQNGQDMARVLQQVADGELTLRIQQTYPLSEIVAAHRQLQKGDAFGKIILTVSA